MNRLVFATAIALAFATSPAARAADDSQGHHGAHEQSAQSGAMHKLHGVVNSVNA